MLLIWASVKGFATQFAAQGSQTKQSTTEQRNIGNQIKPARQLPEDFPELPVAISGTISEALCANGGEDLFFERSRRRKTDLNQAQRISPARFFAPFGPATN